MKHFFKARTAADWIAKARRSHKGRFLSQESRDRRARRYCRTALELEPSNWEALYWLGRLQLGSSDQEAIKCLEQATKLNPDNADVLVYLSNALDNCGRHEAAKPLLKRALALDPRNAEAHWRKAKQLIQEEAPLEELRRELALLRELDPHHPMLLLFDAFARVTREAKRM